MSNRNDDEVIIEVEEKAQIEITKPQVTEEPQAKPKMSFLKRNICISCGNACIMKRVCYSCRKKLPNGFDINLEDEVINAEIQRNEHAKREFVRTTGLGLLSLDTEHFMFSIDNGYFYIHDLEGFSFYNSQPRVTQSGNNIRVTTDVYFTYTIISQPHRERKIIGNLPCKYTRSNGAISIEPPFEMMSINMTFNQMLDNEAAIIRREIAFHEMFNK